MTESLAIATNPVPFHNVLEFLEVNMKILHLIDALQSGGKERQLVEVLKFFSKQKDITCDLAVMSEELHYKYLNDLNIKIIKVLRKSTKDISVYLKFYQLFKELKPDIVHSWNSMCSVYALPAAKMLGIKFVNNFIQNVPPRLKMTDSAWIRAKLTFPFSDVIAANSYAGLKAFKVPAKKSVCLHNGFDFSRVEGLASKEDVRKKFNIHTRYVVGMVANFSENKDYQTFVGAAQMLLQKRKDITFVAVGDGIYFDSVKSCVKPEFNHYFRFAGQQKRVLNIINIFDIGILTTNTRVHGEGIPNVVMEYMALKKPVIVTDCGGNSELVDDKHSGFLVDPLNPVQLKENISLLLENEDLSIQFGQNGYDKLKREFDLNLMGEFFLKLYRGFEMERKI